MLRLKRVLDILQAALPNGYSVGEILGKFIINSPNDYTSLIAPCSERISEIVEQEKELKNFLDTL